MQWYLRYSKYDYRKVLHWSIGKYCIQTVYAYKYVKDKHGAARPVRYVESILRSWYDSNLYTPQDVENSFAIRKERYGLYKTIFNELGFYRQPSKEEEAKKKAEEEFYSPS